MTHFAGVLSSGISSEIKEVHENWMKNSCIVGLGFLSDGSSFIVFYIDFLALDLHTLYSYTCN